MDHLKYIVEEIHTVIAATVDEEGLPVTCAIDLMDFDESGLYFLTAKGKGFYDRLKNKGYIALTGVKGKDTMSSVALSIRGNVKEIGNERLSILFDKNPYMATIYPTEGSRQALTVFKLYKGVGEWFDLSKRPIERASFVIGKEKEIQEGYFITERCTNCQLCKTVCPQDCIDFSTRPARIVQAHCLRCGNCRSICLQQAVERRG